MTPPNPCRTRSEEESILPTPLPMVGRKRELATLLSLLDPPATQRESVAIVAGEGGVGKSRLMEAVAVQAAEEGWTVAAGRAYPVETGSPYALFSDAFLPLLRGLESETLTVLSRGGERELAYLFPALGGAPNGRALAAGTEPGEFKTRLLWNFNELLRNLAARRPLLVILEDLQWADDSSLELLHFIARQPGAKDLVLVGTYNETERDRNPRLVSTERSLLALRVARLLRIEPLTHADTTELVCRTFGMDEPVVREFCAVLWGWTRGNAFFIEEVLKELVETGRLRRREGTWLGWEVSEPALPRSVRDAVTSRVQRLSAPGPQLVDLIAVLGTRVRYDLLRALSGLEENSLLAVLAELRDRAILLEDQAHGHVVYDFVHPLVRDIVYKELGLARARVLHGEVAKALETHYGPAAMEHAGELAYHFARTDEGHLAPKAVRYLTAAGRHALERHADREAVGYLEAARERVTSTGEGEAASVRSLTMELARAHQRLGEYEHALALWREALDRVDPSEHELWTEILRHMGLASFWSGRTEDALAELEAALAAAEGPACERERARALMALGFCYQDLGRGEDALREMEAALTIAERLDDRGLRARAHRSLALVHTWISPPEVARRHAAQALQFAEPLGDRNVVFWTYWGLAGLEGMTGDVREMDRHVERARRVAEEIRSPVLRLWTDELSIEKTFATGEWESGIALGERAIALARSLNQRILLPRLLVITAIFYFGRTDLQRGKELVDEACSLAGVGSGGDVGEGNIHAIVAAHIGLAHYHLTSGNHREAIRTAEKGLSIADGTGYTMWTLHRLIPILAEAYLWLDDVDSARRLAERLREQARRLGHRLADVWAEAGEALIRWKAGDAAGGVVLMREAARSLEEIPMIPAATRLRRMVAARLAELGDREGALQELRHIHELFEKMGAQYELERTRIQFREVGSRPPPRLAGTSASGLTEREIEIARLVSRGRSNKAVGRELGISPRTVSTHLSNIFQKLGVGSRLELAEHVRGESFPQA